jgi:glycopeptide antibiotics resistance protein
MVFDIVLNVGMYLPFGYLGVYALPTCSRLTRIVVIVILGLMLSTGIEIYQLFNPYRYPAVTDIIMNIGGTVLGSCAGSIQRPCLPSTLSSSTRTI